MKEIGGYFGLENFDRNEYHSKAIALNSGRNALLYLLKQKNIKKLYIPYFLCDSISNLCDKYGYLYEYYRIDNQFKPIFDKKLSNDEYLYIVNFYGRISNEIVKEFKKIYGNIIFDNIHAFFQLPCENIDTIYSCRKFFGVPDGAYLYTDSILGEELDVDFSKDRMKHILGRFEGRALDYYTDFKNNEKSFIDMELKYMSHLTHNILRAINYENVKKIRNQNYNFLDTFLKSANCLPSYFSDGPYGYPLYCENGMELKKRLAEKHIYVATLWPNVLELDDCVEKDYAENILPIPCDQRYREEDMQRIIREIERI